MNPLHYRFICPAYLLSGMCFNNQFCVIQIANEINCFCNPVEHIIEWAVFNFKTCIPYQVSEHPNHRCLVIHFKFTITLCRVVNPGSSLPVHPVPYQPLYVLFLMLIQRFRNLISDKLYLFKLR